MTHTRIAVVESNWWRKNNASVRSLFDLVANIACGNPNAYHYEMANSRAAMKEAIPRIGSYRECRYLFIATHGSSGGLRLLNNDAFTKRDVRDTLLKVNYTKQSRIRGVYFESCLFTTERNANYLFEEGIGVDWIAGYTKEVDWIQSSSLNLLFCNELMKYDDRSESCVIRDVAEEVRRLASSLCSELGFGIFVRKRGGGGILNLLTDPATPDADTV